MEKINSETSLREAIVQLERKRAEEGAILREEFRITLDGFKPVNLVKSTLGNLGGSVELKSSLITTATGLTTGYLSKVLISSMTKNPVVRIIGTAALYGITNLIARNPEVVKSLGKAFFNKLRGKSHQRIYYL
jgi:hypothetical protein